MKVGIPKEVKDNEFRVAATPEGVRELVAGGHDVVVETAAGVGSAIGDEDFVAAGASIAADADEVFAAADMIVKVKEPQPQEFPRFRRGPGAVHLPPPRGRRGTHAVPRRAPRAERRLRDRADARRPAAAARPDVGDRRQDGAAGGRRRVGASARRPRCPDGRRFRRRARPRRDPGSGDGGSQRSPDRRGHGGRSHRGGSQRRTPARHRSRVARADPDGDELGPRDRATRAVRRSGGRRRARSRCEGAAPGRCRRWSRGCRRARSSSTSRSTRVGVSKPRTSPRTRTPRTSSTASCTTASGTCPGPCRAPRPTR